MKCKFKKAVLFLLSLLTVFSVVMIVPTASAAINDIQVSLIDYPRGGGSSTWGHPALHFMNGWSVNETNHYSAKGVVNDGMKAAYCVQPGVSLTTGDSIPNILPDDFLDTYNNGSLTYTDIQILLGRIYQYGYTGKVSISMSNDEITNNIATQLIVWETITGERNYDFSKITPPSGTDSCIQFIRSDHPLRGQIMDHYNRIANAVINHSKMPSFMAFSVGYAKTHELTWNGSEYSLTLTDTNNVLSNFVFTTNHANINVARNGNQLILTSTAPPSGDVVITASRNNVKRSAVTFWANDRIVVKGKVQAVSTVGEDIADPLNSYVKVKVSTGNLIIYKSTKNNGGQVSGFDFLVKKSDGTVIGTYTSGNDGRIQINNLAAGTYTVQEINLSDDFVKPTPNPVTVTVLGGQTVTANFDNVKKMGIIKVRKSNTDPAMGDYSLAGAEFTVKDKNGKIVDTIKTLADGTGESIPLPLMEDYQIFESKAPYGFVVNKTVYKRSLSGSQGADAIVYCLEIAVPEKPQLGQITITKLDEETAKTVQGNATLNGAVFDLLDKSGNLVERLYCGEQSSVTSKLLPLSEYTVKEYIPPKGYTLSKNPDGTTKEYPVLLNYTGQDIEINLKSVDAKNTVIKGKIGIIKHSTDPDSAVSPGNEQVQKPLKDIVFRVYLKSAGSYENCKESEKDTIITDSNGFAMTKDLPYGIFRVEELSGNANTEHKVCDPFDVFISENGRIYYYNIENPVYSGKVRIIKVDAETNKPISAEDGAGARFKIKNMDTGEWVTQEILYPTPIIIDEFETALDGTLVLPQALRFGNYELFEQKAPLKYILNPNPIPFKVTAENPVEYLEVRMSNTPAKGIVTALKTGEVFTGAEKHSTQYGDCYVPKYTVQGLQGAKFNIISDENVYLNGEIKYKKGEIVDKLVTGKDGKATSIPLYLGLFHAEEVETVNGFTIDPQPIQFELKFKDQNTALVFADVGLQNQRVKGQVNLLKTAEEVIQDDNGNISYIHVPAKDIVFGLYTRHDILNLQGEIIIPARMLVDVLITNTDGQAVSTCDIPLGAFYLKELFCGSDLVLNDTEYEVIFNYKDDKTPFVTITANDGNPIENKLIKGKIKIMKTVCRYLV